MCVFGELVSTARRRQGQDGEPVFDPHKFWILPTDRYLTLSAWEEKDAELGLAKPRGRPSTHDYMRHGTLTLFAALDVLEGKGCIHPHIPTWQGHSH